MAYINTSNGVKVINLKVDRDIIDDLDRASYSDIVKLMVLSYLESDHIIFDKIMSYNPDIINTSLYPNETITIFHIYDNNIKTKPELIEVLRKYDKNIKHINSIDGIHNNALMVSCVNCDIEMIKFLLPMTHDINRQSYVTGSTALHYVMKLHSRYGNRFMEILNMFIEYGADINKLDKYGCSPLGSYIRSGEYTSLDLDFIGKMLYSSEFSASIRLGILGVSQDMCKTGLIYYLMREGFIDFKDSFLHYLPNIRYSSPIFHYIVENNICSSTSAIKSLLKIKITRKSDEIYFVSKICSIIYAIDEDKTDGDLGKIFEYARSKSVIKLLLYKLYWLELKPKKEDSHV
ncbi:MAG: ankyrin repeat domain-containing protein [Candidatus Anstonellales archaeon]